MAQGLYRDSGGWAQVDYDGKFQRAIHRGDYERDGFKPAFESLPMKEDYLAKPAKKPAAKKAPARKPVARKPAAAKTAAAKAPARRAKKA